MKKYIIGYQGVPGAFSHRVLKDNFPNSHEISFLSFEEVFEAVKLGNIDYGIIPVENSNTGEINDVLDLLKHYNCYIKKTYILKIDQNLLGIKGSNISNIKEVFSHPQGFLQSRLYLKNKHWKETPFYNTAISAKHVYENNNPEYAAIGSIETASLYNLDILEEKINDNDHNFTKFIIISNKLSEKGNKYSLLFSLSHEVGSLSKIILTISKYNFNMLNIKSRPNKIEPWQYYFYIEIEGNELSEEIIKELLSNSIEFKILGRY